MSGFENLSIMEIAERVTPCSCGYYRYRIKRPPFIQAFFSKVTCYGLSPKSSVEEGILEVIEAFNSEKLAMEEKHFNVKTMVRLIKENLIEA